LEAYDRVSVVMLRLPQWPPQSVGVTSPMDGPGWRSTTTSTRRVSTGSLECYLADTAASAHYRQMRDRLVGRALVAGVLLLTACARSDSLGSNRAEVLDEPFPATLSRVHVARVHTCNAEGCSFVPERHCDTNGCELEFTVRVTNPTHRDVNVAECTAVFGLDDPEARSAPFVVPDGGVGGVWLPAGTTRSITGISSLPLSYTDVRRLPSSVDATCKGWDWHGDPPE
jgi:hypothetical protein